MEPLLAATLTALIAALLALYTYAFKEPSNQDLKLQNDVVSDENGRHPADDPYSDIQAVPDFKWATTSPIKIRPFKPTFHLTMALENCPLSELYDVDDTYLDRISLRKQVLDGHPDETYVCNEAGIPAVLELYDWLMVVYLPKRYPSMYKICSRADVPRPTRHAGGDYLYNVAADTYIPLRPGSPREALYLISANIDTDFLLLLPSSQAADGSPIYHLEAFTTCFPSGFSPRQKLSLPLATIHAPVPRYAEKLEKSMDRFFAKLPCGKAVQRYNWAVTTNSTLFSLGGNHLYTDESSGEHSAESQHLTIQEQKNSVVVDECRLRCERQTLHRLPQTKALCFTFKTFLYKLDEVKADGDGPALADAIDGLSKGSAPEMEFYKRGVVWGEKVKEFLRS